MNDNIFRIFAAVIFLTGLSISIYFRRKADKDSGEKVSWKDEGVPMILVLSHWRLNPLVEHDRLSHLPTPAGMVKAWFAGMDTLAWCWSGHHLCVPDLLDVQQHRHRDYAHGRYAQ